MIKNNFKIVIASPHKRHQYIVENLRNLDGLQVMHIQEKNMLDIEILEIFNPSYIFFPHWSWKIPSNIYNRFECIIFHMTDLPFGRGGSPLQNLILKGYSETKLSALRCEEGLDSGPVYMKRDLKLVGSAEEILNNAGEKTLDMIRVIIEKKLIPLPQVGEPTFFKRLTRESGNLKNVDSLNEIYDRIRMLDADNYDNAYIEHTDLIYEFSNATLHDESVIAEVKISRRKCEESSGGCGSPR